MARFDELLRGLGLWTRLENPYAFQTKGEMAKACADLAFLRKEARNTMSCSSPASRRYDPDPSQRDPKHCGRCVPCLIRRAAILEAWGADDTPYRIADPRARVLDTKRWRDSMCAPSSSCYHVSRKSRIGLGSTSIAPAPWLIIRIG